MHQGNCECATSSDVSYDDFRPHNTRFLGTKQEKRGYVEASIGEGACQSTAFYKIACIICHVRMSVKNLLDVELRTQF